MVAVFCDSPTSPKMKYKNKKRTMSKITSVLACSMVTFGGFASGANILLNGSFELTTSSTLAYGNNLPVVPDDWTFTPVTVDSDIPNTVHVTGTGAYVDGPDLAQDGQNYVDISGDGYFSQTVTVAVDSNVTFGGYFSRRLGGSDSGFTSIWDSTNTAPLFSSPLVSVPEVNNIETWVSSFDTVFLSAGTYTFRVEMGNFANADDVSFSPEAVPEVASSVLGMLGMLTFALRRNRI